MSMASHDASARLGQGWWLGNDEDEIQGKLLGQWGGSGKTSWLGFRT